MEAFIIEVKHFIPENTGVSQKEREKRTQNAVLFIRSYILFPTSPQILHFFQNISRLKQNKIYDLITSAQTLQNTDGTKEKCNGNVEHLELPKLLLYFKKITSNRTIN